MTDSKDQLLRQFIDLELKRALHMIRRGGVTPFPATEKDGCVILNRFLTSLDSPFEAVECHLDRKNRRVVPTKVRFKQPFDTIDIRLVIE